MPIKLIISLLLSFLLLILNKNSPSQHLKLLEDRVLTYPHEKVYIHHDKPVYAPGDDIWFKVYLVDARTHLQTTPSQLVYVDLFNDQDSLIALRAIKIDSSYNSGDISLPSDLPPGDYTLRGYTNYMRNFDKVFFFNKQIRIIENSEDQDSKSRNELTEASNFSLDFFPEGGNLIAGLKNKVAFKSINQKGLGRSVEGIIVDSEGNQVAILKSLHKGMGYFDLTPLSGFSYSAIIQENGTVQEFKLPTSLNNGYTLEVNTWHKDNFTIKVNHNNIDQLKNSFIIGHIRGEPYVVLPELENGKLYKLPKNQMPEGVLHLTLFDSKSRPTAERLIYIENDKSTIQVNTALKSDNIGTKQLIQIELTLEKELIDTVGIANLSVAINDKQLLPPSAGSDISNYLLLDSELKGSVENVDYYFTERSRKKRILLDLVMLTNGWRRFKWTDIIDKKDPALSFPPESGFEISGVVTKKNRPNKSIAADIFLTVVNEEFQMHQMTTQSDGRFVFSELAVEGSLPIVLQANEHNAKRKTKKEAGPSGKRNVDILLDSIIYPTSNLKNFQLLNFNEHNESYDGYTEVLKSKIELDRILEGELSIELSEVTVKGKRISEEKKLDRPGQLYSEPDSRIVMESTPGILPSHTIFDIIRTRVPGVEIVGIPGVDAEFRIRGISSINLSSTATVLVDGIPADPTYYNGIFADRIEYVDVLKGLSKTSVYGAAGANGIIAIYTNSTGTLRRPNRKSINGILNSSINGYYQAKEFYMPDYLVSPNNQGLPDLRPTLYWNPNVIIDQSGNAILEFYSTPKRSSYRVDIQGITYNGTPVLGQMEFQIE